MTPESDHLLGRMAVERGLTTEERLRDALEQQQRESKARAIGAILVERGYLSELQLTSLLSEQRSLRGKTTVTTAAAGPPESGRESTVFKTLPFGKYTLLKKLGSGGMGVVYEALDLVLNRRLAIKTLIPGSYPSAEEAARDEERFLREAQLAAGLSKHANIVGVYEAGVIDGKRYLAMEFIDGIQMQEWRKVIPVPLERQIRLLRDVALAVHHAHENGVIHRDLKPANVIVDTKDTPHITDFGLAKARGKELSGSLTDPGIAIGTPAYMSPEQAQGLRSVDRRSDVYSLGVMLYELLTDRVPFTAETGIQMLVKIIEHPVPPPSSVIGIPGHPSSDPALEAICMKALEKAPAARFSSAQEFAQALLDWLEKPPPLLKPAPPPPARKPVAAWAVAGLVALAAGALLLRKPPEPAKSADPKPPPVVAEEVRILVCPDRVNAVVFAPAGGLLAAGCADGSVILWDAATGKEAGLLTGQEGKVEGLAFSPDGKTLAVVTEDPERGNGRGGEVRLWDVERRALAADLAGHEAGVNAVAFSPEGDRLVTGDQRGLVKIWDVKGRKELAQHEAHAAPVRAAAWLRDGKTIVTAAWDHSVKLWDSAGFKPRAQLDGHDEGIWTLAASADGALLASGGSDKTVKLWDAAAAKEKVTLRGHGSVVQGLAFTPDGKRLVSAARDRTVKVWDVAKGAETETFRDHTDTVWTVAVSPDGKWIASGGFDKKVVLRSLSR